MSSPYSDDLSGEAVIERITKEIEDLEDRRLSFYTDMSELINAPPVEQGDVSYEEKKQAAAANIQKYFCGSKSSADSAEVAARLEELLAHLKSGNYQNSELLSDQIANLNQKLENNKTKMKRLEQSEQAAQELAQAAQRSQEDLQFQCDEKDKLIATCKDKLQKWQAAYYRMEESNKGLVSAKESNKHAMEQVLVQLDASRAKSQDLSERLKAERRRAAELDQKATLAQAKASERHAELTKTAAQLQDLQARLRTCEVSLSDAKMKLAAAEQSKLVLEQTMAGLKEKVTRDDQRITDAGKLEIRASVLESENTAFKTKISELEKQLLARDAASTKHTGLELKLAEANIKNEALERKVSELDAKIKEDAALLATLHHEESASGASATRVQLLETQLANVKAMHEKEVADLKERHEESMRAAKALTDRDEKTCEHELREAKEKHAALEKDLAAARSSDLHVAKEARIKQLETELAQAKSRIDELEAALRKVESLLSH